jgi:superoxide reductase
MTESRQIYKCSICGNVVDVRHPGAGQLVCCGKPMDLLEAKHADEGMEKHLPVIERKGDLLKIKVGEVPHPMEDLHHIEWIEVISGTNSYLKFLNPGEAPEMVIRVEGKDIKVRESCNVHGIWESDRVMENDNKDIGFDEFEKVDLRIAEIKEASAVDGSDKLVKLLVQIGDNERQILAGIRKYYSPEELVGKKLVVVANLEPRKIFGQESQGMVLAAKDGENLSVLVLEKDIPSGIRLS